MLHSLRPTPKPVSSSPPVRNGIDFGFDEKSMVINEQVDNSLNLVIVATREACSD
jgi:hypothetical protein